MAIYSLGLQTTVTTINAPAMDIKAAAANSPRIMEIGLVLAVATASTYGLARSTNTPTQTGTTLVQAENPADPAGQSTVAVTWSVAPTISIFLRRIGLPATIGLGIIWTFPRGLVLAAAAASGVIWNLATNANNLSVHFVVDE